MTFGPFYKKKSASSGSPRRFYDYGVASGLSPRYTHGYLTIVTGIEADWPLLETTTV
jgi:hypothetical protein